MPRSLQELEDRIKRLEDGALDVRFTQPEKPRNGLYYFATGSGWNPGAGVGLYRYEEGVGYTFIA